MAFIVGMMRERIWPWAGPGIWSAGIVISMCSGIITIVFCFLNRKTTCFLALIITQNGYPQVIPTYIFTRREITFWRDCVQFSMPVQSREPIKLQRDKAHHVLRDIPYPSIS